MEQRIVRLERAVSCLMWFSLNALTAGCQSCKVNLLLKGDLCPAHAKIRDMICTIEDGAGSNDRPLVKDHQADNLIG